MTEYKKISGFADEIADSLTTQIDSFSKMNIRYVEMRGVDGNNLIYHSDEKVKDIKERLDASGIALSALGSPIGKIGIDDSFDNHFEEYKRAVEIAHMMDTKNIRIFSFYVSHNSVEKNAQYKEKVFERIGKFVDYASKNNVILLHENEKGIYGEKAKECLELMEEFGGEHFKAIFDFANYVQAGQDTVEAYDMIKEYIEYIHVKDALSATGEVVPAGFGDGNVEEILKRLFDNGYNGFLSIEPHLFNFTGFEKLERGNDKHDSNVGEKLNGYEAFHLAWESLIKILKNM